MAKPQPARPADPAGPAQSESARPASPRSGRKRRRWPLAILVGAVLAVATGVLVAGIVWRSTQPIQAEGPIPVPPAASTPPNAQPATPAPGQPKDPASTPTATVPPSPSSAAPSSSPVLVNETFSGGKLPKGWVPELGKWKVVNGRLQASTGVPRARISFGPKAPENYQIDTMVRFVEVADARRWLNVGLDYHVESDWGAVFVARSDTTASDGLELAQRKKTDKKYSSKPTGDAPTAIGVGEDHWLSIEVRGERISVTLDGQRVFKADNMARTGGDLGFVINNSTVQFDNVKVTRLDA